MIKIFTYLLLLFVISSCSTKSKIEKSEYNEMNKDVFSSWYSKTTNFILDTMYINIEKQVSERTTLDSISHLENKFATSDALINQDGSLFHNLILLPQTIPKKFKKPVTTIKYTRTITKLRTITITRTKRITKEVTPLPYIIWSWIGKILTLFILLRFIYHTFKNKKFFFNRH